MYGENTKYHSNPYIQGTTVPCDICPFLSTLSVVASRISICVLYVGLWCVIVNIILL